MEITEKEDLKKLLKKYPFLIHRNVFSGEVCYQTEEENLERNWYTEWDGYGWEKIWKRFMQELFKEYDKLPDEAKEKFAIWDSKEKYGTLRISLSGYTEGMQEAETILHFMSSVTCQNCGKQPRDSKGNHLIWTTKGWIINLCKDCLKEEELRGTSFKSLSKKDQKEFKEYVKSCRNRPQKYFNTTRWASKIRTTTYYADNLERDWMIKAYEITEKEI